MGWLLKILGTVFTLGIPAIARARREKREQEARILKERIQGKKGGPSRT